MSPLLALGCMVLGSVVIFLALSWHTERLYRRKAEAKVRQLAARVYTLQDQLHQYITDEELWERGKCNDPVAQQQIATRFIQHLDQWHSYKDRR